jgi:hypothetical protein
VRGDGSSPPVRHSYPDSPQNSSLHWPTEMTNEWRTNEFRDEFRKKEGSVLMID